MKKFSVFLILFNFWYFIFTFVLLSFTACDDDVVMIPHDYNQPCLIEAWGGDDYVLAINNVELPEANWVKWHKSQYFDTIVYLYYNDTISITSYGDRLKITIGPSMYMDTIHNGWFETTIPITEP